MDDVKTVVKINEMVENHCGTWNAHMKEALKDVFQNIAFPKTDVPAHADAESYEAYKVAQGVIAFMNDSFLLPAFEADKLSDFAADLYYG